MPKTKPLIEQLSPGSPLLVSDRWLLLASVGRPIRAALARSQSLGGESGSAVYSPYGSYLVIKPLPSGTVQVVLGEVRRCCENQKMLAKNR